MEKLLTISIAAYNVEKGKRHQKYIAFCDCA